MTGSLLTLTFGDPRRPPRAFDLEQPRTAAMPIHPARLPGYSYVLHRRHQDTYGQDATSSRTCASRSWRRPRPGAACSSARR